MTACAYCGVGAAIILRTLPGACQSCWDEFTGTSERPGPGGAAIDALFEADRRGDVAARSAALDQLATLRATWRPTQPAASGPSSVVVLPWPTWSST